MEVLLYDATSGNMLPFKVRFKKFKQFIQRNHQQTIIFYVGVPFGTANTRGKRCQKPSGTPCNYCPIHVELSAFACVHKPLVLCFGTSLSVPSYTLLPF